MFKVASVTPAILESAKKDSRLDTNSRAPGPGWLMFEMDEASATKDALGWLGRAYEAAKK